MKSFQYKMSKKGYLELLHELGTRQNVLTYINETYSLCELVTEIIVEEE